MPAVFKMRAIRGHVSKRPAAQATARLSEASSLVVVETQASPIEPRFQHTVLFTQERHHVFPLALQPPAQHRHQQRKHRRSLRQSPDPAWDTTRSLPKRARSARRLPKHCPRDDAATIYRVRARTPRLTSVVLFCSVHCRARCRVIAAFLSLRSAQAVTPRPKMPPDGAAACPRNQALSPTSGILFRVHVRYQARA